MPFDSDSRRLKLRFPFFLQTETSIIKGKIKQTQNNKFYVIFKNGNFCSFID